MTHFFWKRFIGSWLISFFSLQATRLVFYLNLREQFGASFSETLDAFLFGTEFDAVTIAYLLGLFFVALPFLKGGYSTSIAKWYYITMLGAMNFLNCADAEFFKFTARRSTDDLFEFAFLSSDIVNIAPNLIGHFWYLLVAFSVIMLLAYLLLQRLFKDSNDDSNLWKRSFALIPTAIVLIIAARGGFHPIPLSIINAGNTSNAKLSAVVLSTPFTIIKTLGKPDLLRYDFPNNEKIEFNPIRPTQETELTGSANGSNVVVIIVESLASEYVKSLNGLEVGYAPFVDSLSNHSAVFNNGFANGHRSIEGIAAIASSIPTLMYEPYSTSPYAGNSINSLANILGGQGYFTSFLHGGNKNSMNFESFSGQAGYNVFYDRDDYPFPDKHYDGIWGISDHYMLNHAVDLFSDYEKPFFSTIFTLSSHHPYTIPQEYQNRFPKGTLPIHESVGYADQSLKEFFIKASKANWYSNTLFIITADHTSLSEQAQFQTKLGSLRIPIIFFHPSDSMLTEVQTQVMQQIDIMPTVLDLLGYDEPYFSFGVNAFDSTVDHTAIAFKHDQYQLYRNGKLVCFDGENTNFVFDVNANELLQNNLARDENFDYAESEKYMKGFIQGYSKALNENKMTVESWSKAKE
ncbi:MAG: phosphoglycerol transferase MdoB-like AlkP superfamily enzyme [Bacteroidia bacterium]|jgi:phosphoglycerol transferase MdoB-like AlkP superfamily enzyme